MPKRWCQCRGCPACDPPSRRPGNHGVLFDMDSTGTLRCPPCQATATAARNTRPNSAARGYNGEYQRNKPVIINQARHGRPCVICRKPFTPANKITVEHIIPLRDGGTNDLANLGPAHTWCNTAWNRGKRQ